FHEPQPIPLVRSANVDPPIGGGIRLIWRVQGMRCSHRAGRSSGRETHGRMPVGLNNTRLEERGIHHLPLPGGFARMQGSEDASAGEDARRDIGNWRSDLYGRMAWAFPGYAH